MIECEVKQVCEVREELKDPCRYKQFSKELFSSLTSKGIESLKDLKEYFAVKESDGELVADICDIFQTKAREVRTVLGKVQQSQLKPW